MAERTEYHLPSWKPRYVLRGGRQNRRLICPGYDQAKWITIHGTLTKQDWQKFKLHAWLEGDERPWLVTHAGFHPCWLEGAEPGQYHEFIDKLCADAWDCRTVESTIFFSTGA